MRGWSVDRAGGRAGGLRAIDEDANGINLNYDRWCVHVCGIHSGEAKVLNDDHEDASTQIKHTNSNASPWPRWHHCPVLAILISGRVRV